MSDTVFKVDKGLHVKGANSIFDTQTLFNDIVTVNASAIFITGNLSVTGNLTYSNTSITGDLAPTVSGSALGNTTNRFILYATDINATGQIIPTVTNGELGSLTNRWFVYSSNTDVQNMLTANNLIVGTNLLFANNTTKRVGINTAPSGTAALQVSGDVSVTGNISATAITGTINASGNILGANGFTFVSNSATVTSTGVAQVVDQFASATCKYAKYNVRIANTTNGIHGADILLVHEGTNVIMTVSEEFAYELGTFDAVLSGGNVQLTYTGTAGETVRLLRTQVLE
jgi:hypothetical protein